MSNLNKVKMRLMTKIAWFLLKLIRIIKKRNDLMNKRIVTLKDNLQDWLENKSKARKKLTPMKSKLMRSKSKKKMKLRWKVAMKKIWFLLKGEALVWLKKMLIPNLRMKFRQNLDLKEEKFKMMKITSLAVNLRNKTIYSREMFKN